MSKLNYSNKQYLLESDAGVPSFSCGNRWLEHCHHVEVVLRPHATNSFVFTERFLLGLNWDQLAACGCPFRPSTTLSFELLSLFFGWEWSAFVKFFRLDANLVTYLTARGLATTKSTTWSNSQVPVDSGESSVNQHLVQTVLCACCIFSGVELDETETTEPIGVPVGAHHVVLDGTTSAQKRENCSFRSEEREVPDIDGARHRDALLILFESDI